MQGNGSPYTAAAGPLPQEALQMLTPEVVALLKQQGVQPQQVTLEMITQAYQMVTLSAAQGIDPATGLPFAPPAAQGAFAQPSPAYPQPELKNPAVRKKPGGGIAGLLRLFAIIAVVGALAWLLLNQTRGSRPTTAIVESATLGTSYTGDALIVRDETVFDDEGVQSIVYVAEEGSTIYRSEVVCYVYSTGYSNRELATLQAYRDQIKDYQRTLLINETAYDQRMTRLENDVIERGLEVRSLVMGARGNLINQEKILQNAIDQRQKYFRSKYSSDMRLNRFYDDENTQKQRIDGWIKQSAATQESIVSFYTDGFEHALTPAAFEQYSPAEVRSMINGVRPETSMASRGRTDIYRLVRQNSYAVLLLIRSGTWNPEINGIYSLKLEQFTDTNVEARVLSFTRSGGELLVRLAVVGDVSKVLSMRTCQAEISKNAPCLSVPAGALYEHEGAQGVVIPREGSDPLFVPVTVVSRSGDTLYVSAVQIGTLNAGDTVRLFR